MTNVDKLTNDELNAAVAEEVMGGPVFTPTGTEWRTLLSDKGFQYVRFANPPVDLRQYDGVRYVGQFHPATDISAAWEVHQQMQKCLFSTRQRYYENLQLCIGGRSGITGVPAWPDAFGLLKPEDICRAALKTVRPTKVDQSPRLFFTWRGPRKGTDCAKE